MSLARTVHDDDSAEEQAAREGHDRGAARGDAALGKKNDDSGKQHVELVGLGKVGQVVTGEAGEEFVREVGEVALLELEFGVVEAELGVRIEN